MKKVMTVREYRGHIDKKNLESLENKVERRKNIIHCLALLEKITSAYVWMLSNQKVASSSNSKATEQKLSVAEKMKKASTTSLAYLSHVLGIEVKEVEEEAKKIWESCELNSEE